DIPYHFAVLNTDNPNAFATPGGYVFVSIGLLRMVRNEAELAGVLGHEVAHIAKRHALEAIQQSKTLQGLSEVTTSLLDKDPGMLANLVKEMADTLFTRGLGQEKEFEADRVGVNYAYQVGYYPGGLKDFLKVLGQRKSSGSVFFSTHPSPQARFTRLSSQMRRFADATLAPTLARRYASRTQGRLR
ncbi:MAG: M48 family metalloprotease, partial [Nitrospinaceae bacterium]